MDGCVRPERIAEVLGEVDADVIALQEVLSIEDGAPERHQARFIAERLGRYSWHFGENRRLRGGAYGNVILSRLPVRIARNYDLSCAGREQRGCLRADVLLGKDAVLHFFNLHLGTGYVERRQQARKLVSEHVLKVADLAGPRLVVGDFNEWTRGLTSQLMAQHFQTIDPRTRLRRRRTYPGLLPLLHLDHIYFEGLALEHCAVYRKRKALIASDHLPLVADFHLNGSGSTNGTG
jgi:endonuclease/exonuclease/phosphatase family metal-dependent hydrolase